MNPAPEELSAVFTINTYDGFNRLTETLNEKGLASYSYRPDGLRHSKTVNDETTTHLWNGSNIVAELDGDGIVLDTYVRGINLISSANNGYYLFNAHGDVTQLANATGMITKDYHYDAFGVEVAPDDTDANPFRYCGEYFDQETGDIYLRARYYNPVIGRFGAEDPIQDGLNWYTYCINNPIMFIDPTGLASIFNPLGLGNLTENDKKDFGEDSLAYKALSVLNESFNLADRIDYRNTIAHLMEEVRSIAYRIGSDKLVYDKGVLANNVKDYTLNVVEQVLFVGSNPFIRFSILESYVDAVNVTTMAFGADHVWDVGVEADAVRHFVWAFSLSARTGEEFAQLFLSAHEFGTPDNMKTILSGSGTGYTRYAETIMDLHNNSIGISAGSQVTSMHYIAAQSATQAREQLEKGRLIFLP